MYMCTYHCNGIFFRGNGNFVDAYCTCTCISYYIHMYGVRMCMYTYIVTYMYARTCICVFLCVDSCTTSLFSPAMCQCLSDTVWYDQNITRVRSNGRTNTTPGNLGKVHVHVHVHVYHTVVLCIHVYMYIHVYVHYKRSRMLCSWCAHAYSTYTCTCTALTLVMCLVYQALPQLFQGGSKVICRLTVCYAEIGEGVQKAAHTCIYNVYIHEHNTPCIHV